MAAWTPSLLVGPLSLRFILKWLSGGASVPPFFETAAGSII
jgi:hypothetical protein